MLAGGVIAFTGRLASMTRAEASALVMEHRGKPRERVTKDTNVLIVGRAWLAAPGRRAAAEEPDPGEILRCPGCQRVPVSRMGRQNGARGTGEDLYHGRARRIEQTAATHCGATFAFWFDRGTGWPLWLQGPRCSPPSRAASWFGYRTFSNHAKPMRDPEMAPRCATFQSAPLSGIIGQSCSRSKKRMIATPMTLSRRRDRPRRGGRP